MGPVDLHETQLRGPPAEPDLLSLNATATAAMIVAIALQIGTPIGHSSKPAADWRKKSGVMHTSAILHFPPLWAISSTTSSLTRLPRGEILPHHPFFHSLHSPQLFAATSGTNSCCSLPVANPSPIRAHHHQSYFPFILARYFYSRKNCKISFFSLLTTSSRKTPLS